MNPAGPVLLLSATELWERFTYYALRALLLLHLVTATAAGGFGLSDANAAAIYGLFVATVYLSALPGGAIADRYLGPIRAVRAGAIAIAVGNGVLACAPTFAVYGCGLACIGVGVGLLKPNVTALVARSARREGRSLDAAFTLFYVGINVGGIGGPLLAAALASRYGWSAGYAAGAVGMLVGLAAFARIAPALAEATDARDRPDVRVIACAVAVVAAIVAALMLVPPVHLVRGVFVLVVGAAAAGFAVLHRGARDVEERRNVGRLATLFVGATVFWAAGEQAGASLTLFAARFTDREVLGTEFPAAWFQSLYPAYVVLFAPLFALLWTRLDRAGTEPSAVVKFGLGLLVGGGGIGLAALGVHGAAPASASPLWLAGAYLLIAVGEILLSPIGLGAAARLAPTGRTGFATGLWFLSLSLGGLLAGLTGTVFDLGSAAGLAAAFASIATALTLAGLAYLVGARRLAPSGLQS